MKNLFAANGSKLNAIGTIDVDFNLNGLIIPFNAIVTENISDSCILGSDFLNATCAKIDFQSGIISFEDDLVQMQVQSAATKHNYLHVLSHTILPANSESTIPAKVD